MSKSIAIVVLAFSFCCQAEGKCGNSAILIEGAIVGATAGTTVVITINPDPNWEPQDAVSIDSGGRFKATVYFDRTKSEGRTHDDCRRKPVTVLVELHQDGRVVDHVALSIARDFRKTDTEDYELKSAVTLHSMLRDN